MDRRPEGLGGGLRGCAPVYVNAGADKCWLRPFEVPHVFHTKAKKHDRPHSVARG